MLDENYAYITFAVPCSRLNECNLLPRSDGNIALYPALSQDRSDVNFMQEWFDNSRFPEEVTQ